MVKFLPVNDRISQRKVSLKFSVSFLKKQTITSVFSYEFFCLQSFSESKKDLLSISTITESKMSCML